MNRLTLPLLLILASATNAMASHGDHDRRHGEWRDPALRAERLAEELDLTDDQAAQLREILMAADAEREAIRERHRETIESDICTLHNATTSEVNAILNDEQREEFKAVQERMKQRLDEAGERHGRPGLPDCSRFETED